MSSVSPLDRGWRKHLAALVQDAENELVITSPYISKGGVALVEGNASPGLRATGRLTVLSDLSPLAICQGANDLDAISDLLKITPIGSLTHLPRVHAKVYIADDRQAIVTSGNLTAGGLYNNYEYGILIEGPAAVARVKADIQGYSRLGVKVGRGELDRYRKTIEQVSADYTARMDEVGAAVKWKFERSLRTANDELIRLRLTGHAVHAVFANTILYLLERNGPLGTDELHPLIQSIHPDLCDDSVDRVIDGKRFGKKWKHAVRTAQQMLKKKGTIGLNREHWYVIDEST